MREITAPSNVPSQKTGGRSLKKKKGGSPLQAQLGKELQLPGA